MNVDNYVLDGEVIYPLLETSIDNHNYIVYKLKSSDDVIAGEVINDEIVPVSDEVITILENKYLEVKNEIKNGGVMYEN